MDELSCPRCRMTKYRNPSLRLLINVCGHALCEACVELLFTRESAPCPDCGRNLRKNGFRIQLFEDTRVDMEVDIRKGVLKLYNKQEGDFDTLCEYNDYLEEIEEIIWNLETGKNEKETREKMAQYRQENEALIRRNQVRLNQERALFREKVACEAKDRELKIQMLMRLDKEADVARRKGQEELLNDLTNSSSSTEVMARHKKLKEENEKSKTISSLEERMSISGFNMEIEHMKVVQEEPVELFVYKPLVFEIIGPVMPDRNNIFETGYLRHVRESALADVGGGYHSLLACQRALHEAFDGLYANPSSVANGVL